LYHFVIAVWSAKEAQSAAVKSEVEKPPPIPISKHPYAWFVSIALSWVLFFLLFFQAGFFKQQASITKNPWLALLCWLGLAATYLSGLAAAFLPSLICGMKNKWVFMAVSGLGMLVFSRVEIIFIAMFVLAAIGAITVAKPDSWWARTYYGPEKMAIAMKRFSQEPEERYDKNQGQKNRKTGWIIAASIAGLILLVPVLIFVGGFISGLTSGHQRVANGKQVNNAPSANADNPGNLALPDDRCDKALLQGAEKLNATLPRQLDQYSRLDTVLAGHRRMTFFYTIFGLHSGDYTKAQVDEHLDAHQERVKQSYKTMPQLDVYRQNHVEMVYIYKDEMETISGNVRLNSIDESDATETAHASLCHSRDIARAHVLLIGIPGWPYSRPNGSASEIRSTLASIFARSDFVSVSCASHRDV
jgi:hypothetical protein